MKRDKIQECPVLKVEQACRYYNKKEKHVKEDGSVTHKSTVKAVDGVSFELAEGEILGVIGESGCGKSTLGRLLVGLERTSGGTIYLNGENIDSLLKHDRRKFRRQMQMVFQNPFDTFDPHMSIEKVLVDTMKLHGIGSAREERRDIALEKLENSGLLPGSDFLGRFPHELSGGQLQRISIMRAMLLTPSVIVADEPVSMLDVSIRADIINLLYEMTKKENTASVFISHDITTTRYISNRIAVMYLGRIVEIGEADEVAVSPRHPYTEALISNCSSIDPREKRQSIALPGEPPTPVDIPPGCPFWPRCPRADKRCRETEQTLKEVDGGHFVRCNMVTG